MIGPILIQIKTNAASDLKHFEIAECLTKCQSNLIDIRQEMIHEHLYLSIIAHFPNESALNTCQKMLVFPNIEITFHHIDQLNRPTQNTPIQNDTQYQFIVTLVGRSMNIQQLSEASQALKSLNQNILRITALHKQDKSIRITEQSASQLYTTNSIDSTIIGFELCVQGNIPLTELRSNLKNLTLSQTMDVFVQPNDQSRAHYRLIAFDMDSTLIQAEVIDELAKENGTGEQVSRITESAMRGEIDFNESFKQRLRLLKGLDESTLLKVAERLVLTEGAQTLIQTLKSYGYKTAIISGGFAYFAIYLQKLLGIDYVYSNTLDIVNHQVTGKVKGEIVNADRKSEFLSKIAKREGIHLSQTIAIGDGANDLPMLILAGMGIAFQAKPIVQKSAHYAINQLGLDAVLYVLGIAHHSNLLDFG